MQRILLLIITVTTCALCAKGQDVNTFSIQNYNPSIIEKKLNIDSIIVKSNSSYSSKLSNRAQAPNYLT